MPLDGFKEDTKEFSHDLAQALEYHHVPNAGEIAEKWHRKTSGEKVQVLYECLPPVQRFMFALRDLCVPSDRALNMKLHRLRVGEHSSGLAEHLSMSLGYVDRWQNVSTLASIPGNVDLLMKRASVFVQRVCRKGKSKGVTGATAQSQQKRVAESLHAQAKRMELQLTPEGVPLSLQLHRALFRVQLMQALARVGHQPTALHALGVGKHMAIDVLRTHQAGDAYASKKDDRRSPWKDSAHMFNVSTINRILRLLPSFRESQEMAAEYFRLYEPSKASDTHPCKRRIKEAVTDLQGIALEARDKKGGEQSRLATIEMLARIAGIRNLCADKTITALQNPKSKERKALTEFCRSVGIEIDDSLNSTRIAEAILDARHFCQSIIWIPGIMMRK